MKSLFAFAVVACLLATSPAHAAPRIGLAKVNDAWTLWLRGEELNGQFDTVDVRITPSGSPFINLASGAIAGVPRAPGDSFTYRSRWLDQDPLDGGLGWSILGYSPTANELKFGGGPWGKKINTSGGPQGWIFLANFYTGPPGNSPPVSGRVQLYSSGRTVGDLPILLDPPIIPNPLVPEPAAGVLGVFALAALRTASRGRRPAT